MIKLKLLLELEYPLANKEDLQSYNGMEGWKGKLIWMSPEKFLRLASPLPHSSINKKSYQNIKHRIINGLSLDFLVLEIDVKNKKVTGHEGRHRAMAALELGIKSVPVLIYTGSSFKRVPDWDKKDHDFIDKSDFKPEWEKLQEDNTISGPATILGAITDDKDVISVNGKDEYSRHPASWERYTRWRYTPEIRMLFWWSSPSEIDDSLVKDYLTGKGYTVRLNYACGVNLKENKKTLIMEDTKEKESLNFLKNMVQNGPYRGKVYLAGGAVRDMEMGKTPKDLDVVVVGDGLNGGMNFAIWLAKQMGNYKQDSNPVLFPTYGTAKVVLSGYYNGESLDGMDVEAVASRVEKYNVGSRKPEVSPGTLEDDVLRRDFTVNSLVYDLTNETVLDLTGKGKEDIKNGIIRTTSDPDTIFGQDALRMFRAIRFATKYNWKMTPELTSGIKNNLHNLNNTSKERIRDELNKILLTDNPEIGIRLLRDTGLLPYISKELQSAVGMVQNKHHVHDVFDHSMEVLRKTNPKLLRRLIALFHDVGKVVTRSETPTGVHFYGHEKAGAEIVEKTMRDLKYPSELIDAVKLGVRNHMRLKSGGDTSINLSDKSLRKFKIEMGEHLEDILNVIHADNIAHADASAMPNQIDNIKKRLEALDIKVTKPNLPINGNDLIQLGFKPGAIFTKILGNITDAWYSNPNLSREEAIIIAKQIGSYD